MTILLYILFVLTIISNIVSALFYIKSANRKAHYTMIEIKALRQVRDQIERLSKWKTQSVNNKEKEMDSDLVKELLCLFILIVAFWLILYIIGIKWGKGYKWILY